jgi:hypothetical protein
MWEQMVIFKCILSRFHERKTTQSELCEEKQAAGTQ